MEVDDVIDVEMSEAGSDVSPSELAAPALPAPPAGGFRFCSKTLGLTYSCPVDADDNPIQTHEEIIDMLNTLGKLDEYIVGKELHASGKVHWHAYGKYDKKLDTRNARFCDLKGVHPNIKSGCKKGWILYCAKDKDWKSNFYENDPYHVAMKLESLEQAVNHLFEKVPRDTVLNLGRVEYAYNKLHARAKVAAKPFKYKRPYETDFNRTILVEGESNWGKTQWAKRCFQRPLLVRAIEDLRQLRHDTDGIVFDDMSFTHWPRQTQIHLTDMEEESSLPARYSNITIPAGMPRIMCYNPGFQPVDLSDPAIARRCRVIVLDGDIRDGVLETQ